MKVRGAVLLVVGVLLLAFAAKASRQLLTPGASNSALAVVVVLAVVGAMPLIQGIRDLTKRPKLR